MNSIYMRNLVHNIWDKKKIIFIFFVIFTLVFTALGWKKSGSESSSQTTDSAYSETIQSYDKSIAQVEESVEIAQQQVDEYQDYCDNSIYMSIDAENVQTAAVQYAIQTDNTDAQQADNQVQYVLGTWTSYINNGGLTGDLAAEDSDLETEYLEEIISCSTSGNVLTITVIHSDMNQAAAILQMVEEQIDAHKDSIADVQGEFTMTQIDSFQYVNADLTVQNTQNTNLNNLRNYKGSLASFEKTLNEYRTSRNNYIENYGTDEVESQSAKKIIAEYAVLGMIFGLVVPIAVYALIYIFSNRIKGKEDILAGGLPVLCECNHKKGYNPSLERALIDIGFLAQQKAVNKIFLNDLCGDDRSESIKADFKDKLKEKSLQILSGNSVMENAGQMQDMLDAKNSILIVETGKTTYSQVEEQIQVCHKFEISIWGCIVID